MFGTKFTPRYIFKFLVKVSWHDEDLKLNKLGPTINQLGVEEFAASDEFLYSYYSGLDWELFELDDFEMFGRADFTLWKSSSNFTQVVIKPITLDSLIKKTLDNNYFSSLRLKNQTARKGLGLDYGFFSQVTWNPESDYSFVLRNLTDFLSWAGSYPTYSRRAEMLGRKINFRRKVQKKKFEEY